MQETYYYLARYLFEYYLPALEFGIPPEKQFIAPRTSVLNKLAKEYTKFYYRTDRPVMTVSMPQGTGKTAIGQRFLSWVIGKDPDKPNMFVSYSASIAKDKGFNGIDALINDDMGNYRKIFPKLREIYRSAETMSLDYRQLHLYHIYRHRHRVRLLCRRLRQCHLHKSSSTLQFGGL